MEVGKKKSQAEHHHSNAMINVNSESADTNRDGNLHAETNGDLASPSSTKTALLLTGVFIAAFIAALDRTIITTAIPQITDDFASPNDAGWYGSAYLLTACAFQPLWGRAYTHFALRSTYLLALAIFEVGSLICGVAPRSAALIVGRALAGVGCGGVLAGNLNVISANVPLARRALFIGLVGSV